MGKLDLSAYDAIIGQHYPCCICGKPGVQWFGKNASGCADHLGEAEAKARADHEKVFGNLAKAKSFTVGRGWVNPK